MTAGWGKSEAGVPTPGATLTIRAGDVPVLAVIATYTGRGSGSGGLYWKTTALGDDESVGSVNGTAMGAAATAHIQSFRARDPQIFI